MLHNVQQRCVAYEQSYQQEKQQNTQGSRAYSDLYAQHKKTVQDLANLARKCRSLEKELKNAQKAPASQEHKQHIAT